MIFLNTGLISTSLVPITCKKLGGARGWGSEIFFYISIDIFK